MSKNLSFRSRMLTQILPVVIIGLFTFSFIIYWQVYTTVEKETYSNMQSRTGEIASNINLWLKSKLVDIEIYAANPIAQKVNVDRQAMADMHYSRLSTVLQLFPEEKPINVYSIESDGTATGAVLENGTIVIKTINVSDMGYFKRIMSGEPGYMKEPQYARSVKGVIIGPSAPIKKDGKVIGVVGATFSTELITKKISQLKFGHKGYGMLISADGNYIEHPDRRKIAANDSPEANTAITKMSDEPDKNLQALYKKILTEESGTFKFVQDGKTKIAFYQQIPVAKWSTISIIDAEELFATANQLLYVMLTISLFVIAVLSLIIYFASVRLAVPLQQLSSFANQLAGSDFSEGSKMSSGNEEQVDSFKISTRLLHAAPQEVEELGLTFNYMAERIKNNMEALKRANQALRSSEEKFSKTFHYSSDAIVLLRTSDKWVIEINDTFINILGCSREEIINKSINEFQLWYDPEERAATIQTLANEGKVKNIEARWCYKSGEVRVGLYSAETLVINGEECRLIAWRDIMERKQAEEALRLAHDQLEIKVELRTQDLLAVNEELQAINKKLQQTLDFLQKREEKLSELNRELVEKSADIQTEKDRLSSLVSSLSDEVWFADMDRKFTLVNKKALQELRLGFGEIDIGELASSLEVLRPDGSPRSLEEAPALRALQGEIVRDQLEIFRIPASGELRYREVSSNPVMDIDRNIIGSVSVVRDITDRKAMEDELKKHRDNLRVIVNEQVQEILKVNTEMAAIVASISDPFYILDKEWRLTYLNKEASVADIKLNETHNGQNIWEILPQLVGGELYEKCHEACATNRHTHTLYKSTISETLFEAHLYPYANGLFVHFRDITEQKKYEEELSRLGKLNLIGEMAAGIAHEIRNPLTTVRGYLQYLTLKAAFADYSEQFELMIEELDRANVIITDFLSLAKNQMVTMISTDLNKEIRSIFSLLQADVLLRGNNIELELQEIPEILANDKEMRQCILNLVVNGLDAMPEGGLLTISTAQAGNQVIMTVRDKGHGIAPELKEKLWIPFFTTKDHGTGLGLPICYRIAERHQATFEVETGPEGTAFHLIFNLEKITD